MSVTINGTSGVTTPGIANSEGYTGDGLTIAAGAPAGALQINSAGNAGLGVTPSAWGSGYTGMQLNNGLSLMGSNVNGNLVANAYFDGSNWRYKQSGVYSNNFYVNYGNNGSFVWSTAPSGTAGNTISFTQAMTLAAGSLALQRPSAGANTDFVFNNEIGAARARIRFGGTNEELAFFQPVSGGETEVARFSSGNLLVGYTSSNGSYKLQVNSQIFATSSTIATSDAKYKTDVVPLKGNALSLVDALNPVQFTWKQHPVHDFNTDIPTIGFLAQEVQDVLKDTAYVNSVVKESECELPDGVKEKFLGIAEGNLVALLTAAIQELKARIEQLETK